MTKDTHASTKKTLIWTAYWQALNVIHQESVNTFLNFNPMNGVFGVEPSAIAGEELELPRYSLVVLS